MVKVNKLDFNKIENLEGWGKQSIINLKYSINLRKIEYQERDILDAEIRIRQVKISLILIYFTVERTEEDKKKNKIRRKKI